MTAKIFFTQKVPNALKIAAVKTWGYIKQAKMELIVLAGVLALDLLTKAIVGWTMEPGQSVNVFGDWFTFTFVFNPYAGAGFLRDWFNTRQGLVIFFIIFTLVSVSGFSVAMFKFRGQHWLSRVTFALIIAGALGNFYDRMFVVIPEDTPLWAGGTHIGYNGVRDFFSFGRFPIFNVADMALVGGVAVFAIYFIFMHKPKPPPLCGPVMPEGLGVVVSCDTVVENNCNMVQDCDNNDAALSIKETNLEPNTDTNAGAQNNYSDNKENIASE